MKNPELSVVVPCYNEEESLAELYRRMKDVCEKADVKGYEIILVNDGSSDGSLEIMHDLVKKDKAVIAVDLSRNFGHEMAMSAGFAEARGDFIFVLDADLQDPPELLHPMLERAHEGVDVVYGQRKVRKGETWFKLFAAKWFYKTMSYLSETKIPENVGDFRLMTRRVLDQFLAMSERHRYVRGMISWVGYTQEAFPYERDPRFAGVTKYPFIKLLHFGIDAISSFSIRPLRISLLFAFFGVFLAGLLSLYALYGFFFKGSVAGWTSLAIMITFFSSLQLICIGVIGEYIGRIYMQVKDRPLYIVRKVYGGPAEKA